MSKVGAHNYFKIHMLYPMEMIPTFASHPCGLNHNRQMHSKKCLVCLSGKNLAILSSRPKSRNESRRHICPFASLSA